MTNLRAIARRVMQEEGFAPDLPPDVAAGRCMARALAARAR